MNKLFMTIFGIILLLSVGGILHAQATSTAAVTLDRAVLNSAQEIEGRLANGIKVVVLNFDSASERLSNYVIDEMITALVRGGKVIVVDRANLELIQREMNFQLSGEVSDSSAQAIGQKLGAQSIISGSLEDIGNYYRMRFRTIDVVTAAIQASTSNNVQKDSQVATLMGRTSSAAASPSPSASAPSTTTTITFPTTTPGETVIRPARDQWYRRWVWMGLRLGLSPNVYLPTSDYSDGDFDVGAGFNIAAHFQFQLANFFALQLEFMYTYDEAKYHIEDISGDYLDVTTTYSSLFIPILAKFNFFPGIVTIGFYGGIYFGIPLGSGDFEMDFNGVTDSTSVTIDPLVGIMFGLDFGVKAGPGIVLLDFRFAIDLDDTYITSDSTSSSLAMFSRFKMPITVGYIFGLGKKR